MRLGRAVLWPVGLAACASMLAPVGGAAVAQSPTAPQPLMTAAALPTWQTNGVVYAVENVGGVVYVAGNFTAVRPPGAAPGQDEVARKNMAALDAATGELLAFSHHFSAPDFPIPQDGTYDKTCSPGSKPGTYTCDTVYEIRASPDGSTIYVGGDFDVVDGQPRRGLAAFSRSSGNLTPFRVDGINWRVRALAVSERRVYFGGLFTRVGDQPRSRLAAVDRSTYQLTDWAPEADASVLALALSPDASRVIVGGSFHTLNGVDIHALAAVDADTGQNVRWDSRPIPTDTRNDPHVTDLDVDADTVYASAEGWSFDGRLAADPYTGQVRWIDNCMGATWAVEVVGDVLYSGSHAHNCKSTPGGFPESWTIQDPYDPMHHRFLAQVARGPNAERILHWFPTTNGGIVGSLGPRDLTDAGSYLWAGGEFTTVNGQPQQGLTRFAVEGPGLGTSARPAQPEPPYATSYRAREVTVVWEATTDLDDESLTYTLYRGSTPVYTTNAVSKPYWRRPAMSFTDAGLTPGATYGYQVVATDDSGQQSAKSWVGSVRVSDRDVAYRQLVLSDGARVYWPLDEPYRRFAAGLVDSGGSARYSSAGITYRADSAVTGIPDGGSVRLDGVNGQIRGSKRAPAPAQFSAELWFRTATDRGGKLLGYSTSNVVAATVHDRHVYMTDSGQLVFGVDKGARNATILTSQSYNDGQWHHLVASLGADGMRLHVDGRLVGANANTYAISYPGYWRVGGDVIGAWRLAPTSDNFAGELDEFAVYPAQLSADQVNAHYSLR